MNGHGVCAQAGSGAGPAGAADGGVPQAPRRSACRACPHACTPAPGATGICRARVASGNGVAPGNYGRVTSLALDPVEKKPIACWRGGATVLSLGSYGCNMSCPFCQNAGIAAAGEHDVAWREMTPRQVVDMALSLRGRGCIGVAFTYNEPLVGWEFVRDTGQLAHAAGLANVLVSNGMADASVARELAPLVDAANIDLKCFSAEGYRRLGGHLDTVRHTIELLAACPTCHLEVTTLVVPGISDDEAQVDAAARWLASLDPSIPYHLTRFFPQHRMADAQPTPLPTLQSLRRVARRHLSTVLLGNC